MLPSDNRLPGRDDSATTPGGSPPPPPRPPLSQPLLQLLAIAAAEPQLRPRGEWLRTFVDNHGIRVFLRGFPMAESLVLSGRMPIAGGAVADVRATWAPVDESRFRQRYETSTDGGATWTLLLQTEYSRK
jgi:hypothetical protein